MKEKIKEVQNYFIAKILNNEFEVKHYGMHTMVISVDDYSFEMWMSNTPHDCRVYGSSETFMQLELSEDQAILIRDILNVPYLNWRKNSLIAEKIAELEKLTAEFNASTK